MPHMSCRNIFPYVTRVERARIIAARAQKLSIGVPTSLTQLERSPDDEIALATHELHAGVLDHLEIVRKYPKVPEDEDLWPSVNYCPRVVVVGQLLLKNDY